MKVTPDRLTEHGVGSRRRRGRVPVFVLATAIGVAAGSGLAYADSKYSVVLTYHYDRDYDTQAQIRNSPGDPAGWGRVYPNPAPAPDWEGRALAQIFRNGAFCKASTYAYSGVPWSYLARSVQGQCGSGNYIARGYTGINIPDLDWWMHYTNNTPQLPWPA